MDNLSQNLAEDLFLREPVDPRIRKPKEEEKDSSHPQRKVELQTVRLHDDSQRLVHETLEYIYGPGFKLENSGIYKDKGSNLKNRYWIEQGNLVVQGGCDYSIVKKTSMQDENSKLRKFALKKLEKYNFHEAHCAEALDKAAEEIDKAQELLFYKYFVVDPQKKPENFAVPISELETMRSDEMSVLLSIYDTSFRVKESNVWTVILDLDYITELYKKKDVKRKLNTNHTKTKKKEVCKLFLQGHCSFGSKCKFLHERNQAEPTVFKDSTDQIEYELEIRFPEGTLYPYQVPVLSFKTVHKNDIIPEIICLRITARLVEEAQKLVEDGTPSIFTIVELLKNEEEMTNFIKSDNRTFPEPYKRLFSQVIGDQEKEKLPTHYKKNQSKEERSNIKNYEAILRDNQRLLMLWKEKQSNGKYQSMMKARMGLPAWNKKDVILNKIRNHQVVVISGETGCGKSTQVPQFILDDWFDRLSKDGSRSHVEIICTQPRRISAIGLADRVAEERNEKTGHTVGYTIRLESKTSSTTRLHFCTTGILIRRLETDPQLTNVTHVIVDEVHERSDQSDFLLLILRDLLRVRYDLRVILMSATLNAELFSNYFGGAPIVQIQGRTHPVHQMFLEDILDVTEYVLEESSPYARKIKKGDKRHDTETEMQTCNVRAAAKEPPPTSILDENLTLAQLVARYSNVPKSVCKNLYFMDIEKINLDLIEEVLNFIVKGVHCWPREGAILVFLPGIAEIMALYDKLQMKDFWKSKEFVIIPLHSTLTSEEQSLVFKKQPVEVRKIILSTNIAETSVTIDDCVFVIDTGRMKESRFDSNRNMDSLDLVWESRANAKQRMGRAGRVMPGIAIHLFTSHRYNYHFLKQPVPEIHRKPLEQLLLKIKVLPLFDNMLCHDVLAKILEPPAKENIDGALTRLQDVGALDTNLSLTALGKHLATLPVDVRIGKLMLFGAIFCCVDSALTMAACLSHKSPFIAQFGKKTLADAKRQEFAIANSDHLTQLRAYRKWQEMMKHNPAAAANFANESFLSQRTLVTLGEIKNQLLGLLASIGFVPEVPELRRRGGDLVAYLTPPELNANGDNNKILAAILCAALYPNIVKVLTPEKSFNITVGGAIPRHPPSEELQFKTKTDGYVSLHPSSVNASVRHFASPYLVYQEKVKTSRVFIRECSMVPQLPLLLFSACDLAIELHNGTFVVSLEDGWIMFQVEKHEVAAMLKAIRVELVNLLEEKIKDPTLNLLNYEKGKRIIDTIVHIITKD